MQYRCNAKAVRIIKGIEYICELYKKSYNSVAEELGISRQSIYGWLKNLRPIPKKHLSKLSEIFGGLDEEYFQKELSEKEKIDIQRKKLNSEYKNVVHEYEYSDIDPETGQEVTMTSAYVDEDFLITQIELDYKIRTEKLNRDIQETLNQNLKVKDNFEEEIEMFFNNSFENANDMLVMYEKFVKVIKHGGITKYTIQRILDGMINYEHDFWGIPKNQDEFSKKITKVIQEEEDSLKEKINNKKK